MKFGISKLWYIVTKTVPQLFYTQKFSGLLKMKDCKGKLLRIVDLALTLILNIVSKVCGRVLFINTSSAYP